MEIKDAMPPCLPEWADEGATPPPSDSQKFVFRPLFSEKNYFRIPHACFRLVQEKRLIPFDLATYAYFLGRAGAMEACGKADFTSVPELQVAKELNCCTRSVRSSVKRLREAGILERQETPRNSRTRILLRVKDDGKVDWRAPRFPTRQIEDSTSPSRADLEAELFSANVAADDGDEFPIW